MEEQAKYEVSQPNVKILKVVNPLFVGEIANVIREFSDKIKVPSITYETLYSYFCNTVQHGGEKAEFWVAYTEDGDTYTPLAFAHWYCKGLPHRGVVACDFIHSWNRMSEPISLLIDEFIKFGAKNRAPYYEGDSINEVVFRVFRRAATKKGIELIRTEIVNFIGRRKPNG